jgi:hypothetical protein
MQEIESRWESGRCSVVNEVGMRRLGNRAQRGSKLNCGVLQGWHSLLHYFQTFHHSACADITGRYLLLSHLYISLAIGLCFETFVQLPDDTLVNLSPQRLFTFAHHAERYGPSIPCCSPERTALDYTMVRIVSDVDIVKVI